MHNLRTKNVPQRIAPFCRYEGAWLRHGRPQRFKGNEFANIFTHFSPFEWNGPGPSAFNPDTTKPLPMLFHGYCPWRCDTVSDDGGSGCTVTDAMESVWKPIMERRQLSDLESTGSHDEL